MKVAKKVLGIVLVIYCILLMDKTTYADAEIPASEFEDEDFYYFVMENYDVDGDGILMESEAQTVTYFEIIGESQISSIKGIEYFININELVLNGKITDISPVGALTNLEKYDMDWCNEVEDYSVLNKLTNMKYLDLAQTNVSDLSFVEYMPNLKQIFLSNCADITDFSPMESADNLQFFIADNTSFSDLSVLQGKNISRLNVMGCKGIDDYSLISQFDLYLLAINGDTLTDLSILDGCTHLQYLYIDGAADVTDWSVLSTYSLFLTLELTNCNLSDISFVEGLDTLSNINFSGNNITDISPLMTAAENIKYLYLNDNELTDISIVTQFPKLYELQVQNNKLTTIPDMTGLEKLLLVYLGGNEITEEEAAAKISCTYSLISGSSSVPNIDVTTGNTDTETSDNITDSESVTTGEKVIESVLDESIKAEGQFDDDTYLEGERIIDISGYQSIIDQLHEKIQNIYEIKVYDIALYKDMTENENIVKVKVQPNKSVKVSIRVRDIISGAGCSVYRQEDDGSITKLASYREGQIVTFYSDHFSIFTLVITKLLGEDTSVDNGDVGSIFGDEAEGKEKEPAREYDTLGNGEDVNQEKVTTDYYDIGNSDDNNVGTESMENGGNGNKEDRNNREDTKKSDKDLKDEASKRDSEKSSNMIKGVIVGVVVGIVVLDIVAYEVCVWDSKKKV